MSRNHQKPSVSLPSSMPSRTVKPSSQMKFDATILNSTVQKACARYSDKSTDPDRRHKLGIALDMGLRGARSLHHRCMNALKHWQKVPTKLESGEVVWIFRDPIDHELTLCAIESLDHDIALIQRTLVPLESTLSVAFAKAR